MNLRDVCAKYLEVNPQFAKQTKQKMGYSINRWGEVRRKGRSGCHRGGFHQLPGEGH